MNISDLPTEILSQIGEIQNITFPRQGHTSIVAILHTINKKYVIKRTENELYNEWLANEYRALQYLSLTELQVPKVYAYHVESDIRWILMEYIHGMSLREFLSKEPNPKDKEKAISNFGLCLKRIHSCPCPKELINSVKQWLDTMLYKAEFNLNHYEVD